MFSYVYLDKPVSERTRRFKARRGICRHWGCARDARPNATDCSTCHSRKVRMRNPIKYAFRMVKESARKRDINFDLTFKQFVEFDRRTNYVARKGKNKRALSIDRIDSSRGYTIDNIRALTISDNCGKRFECAPSPDDYDDYEIL